MVNWYAWPVALGGAVAVTWIVYHQNWKTWKALLRFLGVFGLIFLLFKPSWNAETQFERKANVQIFTDISTSAKSQSIPFAKEVSKLLQQRFNNKIQLNQYYFGSKLADEPNDSLESLTRLDVISDFLKQESRQPDAVLVISDGIINRGTSPLNSINLDVPVYTFGVGDDKSYPDARVLSIGVNPSVFKGNEFEVEATIQTELLRGKSVTVDFLQNGKLQSSKLISSNRDFEVERITFIGKADVEGLNKIDVTVRVPNVNEKNLKNNSQRANLDVVSEKKKIAVVYQSVHPDIGAIKSALRGLEQYEIIECKKITDIPSDVKAIVAFDLDVNSMGRIQNLQIPYWIFTDNPSILVSNNSTVSRGNSIKNQSVTPAVNQDFQLFSLEKLPVPMKSVDCPLLKLNVPKEKVQLYQEWNRVTTGLPLCFVDDIDVRKLYFAGFGIWKWRIHELKQTTDSKWFDEWVRSNIAWLSNQFEVQKGVQWNLVKSNWQLGEQRKFKFELFDLASKKVENAKLTCKVIDPNGNNTSIPIAQNLSSYSGVYRPNIGGRHIIKLNLLKPIPGVLQTEFIKAIDIDTASLELQNLKANHQLLLDWSQKTDGKFFVNRKENIDSLLDIFDGKGLWKPRLDIQIKRVFGNDEILLLCLIALLFGAEWFLRKWEGKI